MTVSMQLTKRIYQGNGVTREWEVDFPLIRTEDLKIFITSPLGVETEVLSDFSLNSSDYTLTFPTLQSGKDPLEKGWSLTVLRQTPLTQEVDLIRQGDLDAEVLEKGYDKLTLMVQELNEKVDRSIKYPVSTQEKNLDTESFLNNILSAKEGALAASQEAVSSAKAAQDSAAVIQQIMDETEEKIEACTHEAEESVNNVGKIVKAEVQSLCEAAESAAKQAQQYATNTVAKCIGEVFYSQSSLPEDNPGALPLFTGETILSADSLYPDFYTWLENHEELQVTAEAYEEALTRYGECPKYVISQGTIRLPKLAHFIKMANHTEGITQEEAGLPNITGESGTLGYSSYNDLNTAAEAKGALKQIEGSNTREGGSNSVKGVNLAFDASLSCDVYGKSATVTPSYTTLYPWVVAYHAGKEMHDLQAARWLEHLEEKTSRDLDNLSAAGENKAAVLSMPSDQFVGLALAESGSSYVAPESGYFQFTKQAEIVGEYIRLQNNTSGGISSGMCASSPETLLSAFVPVQKGDNITVCYTATGTTHTFRFVYAQGSQSV